MRHPESGGKKGGGKREEKKEGKTPSLTAN
jgi:hypothetical protein